MSAINTQKQLLDTIESLEVRIKRHEDVIHNIKTFVRQYKDHGQMTKQLQDMAKYIEALALEVYK